MIRNGPLTPLTIARMILTGELLVTALLDPLNRKLAETRERVGHSHHLGEVNINTLWQYITTDAAAETNSEEKPYATLTKMEKLAEMEKRDLGKKRYQVIHSHLGQIEYDLELITSVICKNAQALFEPSSYATVDESVLAYAGEDMIAQMIQVFIPRKPHPFGILFHGAVMLASHSCLPILVDWEWRHKDSKLAPTAALKKLVTRTAAWNASCHTPLTVICDSGFSAPAVLTMGQDLNVTVIASVRGGPTAPYRLEYDLASENLLNSQTRTILSDGVMFQARIRGGKPTVVATAHYKPDEGDAPKAHLTREKAIAMAQLLDGTWELADFLAFCPALPSTARSKYDIACFLCGEDVAFPPKTKDQLKLLTPASMKGMKKWQLDELVKKLKIKDTGGTVQELIEKIAAHAEHPKSPNEIVDEACKGLPYAVLASLKEDIAQMRGPPSHGPVPMVEKYCELFNGEDRVNRTFYRSFNLKKHKNLNVIQLHDMIWNALYNAYVAFIETASEDPQNYVLNYHVDPKRPINNQISLADFMKLLHKERHEAGLQRKCSRPTDASKAAVIPRLNVTDYMPSRNVTVTYTPPSNKRSNSETVKSSLQLHSQRLGLCPSSPIKLPNATPTVVILETQPAPAVPNEPESGHVRRSLHKEFEAIQGGSVRPSSGEKRSSPYRIVCPGASKVPKTSSTHKAPTRCGKNLTSKIVERPSRESYEAMLVDDYF